MKKNNIFLADDHATLREGLRTIINAMPGCEITGSFSTGTEVISAIEAGNIPDVIMLDLNMPELPGYETAVWLKKHHPQVKIIVFSMFGSEVAAIRMLKQGAKSILKKDVGVEEIKKAIIEVTEGRTYFCSNTTGNLAEFFSKGEDSSLSPQEQLLTDSEIGFIRVCTTEKTYKEISSDLGISFKQVDNMRVILFRKLGVQSRVGIVLYAMKHGLITF